MNMTDCMTIANEISDADRDALIERVDDLIATGMAPADAQRMAVNDMLAEVEADLAEMRNLVMEQHPDLFPTTEPYVSKFFSDPDAPRFEGPEYTPLAYSRRQDEPFYSALTRGIEGINTNTAPPVYWKDAIKGLVNKGAVKADEVNWSGVNEWLDMQDGKTTKQDVLDYLEQNGVHVEETVLGTVQNAADDLNRSLAGTGFTAEPDDIDSDLVYTDPDGAYVAYSELPADVRAIVDQHPGRADGAAKYHSYTLPGGDRYRELLLTLPTTGGKAQQRLQQSDAALRKFLVDEKAFSDRGARDYALDAARGDLSPGQMRFVESDEQHARLVKEQRAAYLERENAPSGDAFKSGHWDEPNVLAHIRFNDRIDADGQRVLFIEEIQSDWAQVGKKHGFLDDGRIATTAEEKSGYWEVTDAQGRFVTNVYGTSADTEQEAIAEANRRLRENPRSTSAGQAVPSAPFVGRTDAWVALAIKRMVKYAVDNGYDRVAFINGEQSADRYDLSKQVDRISYVKVGDERWRIDVRKDKNSLLKREATARELEDIVGKDIARKIIDGAGREVGAPEGSGELQGLDLKVGGEGMRAFYDRILPNVAKDVLKKLGGGGLHAVPVQIASHREGAYSFGGWKPENARVLERSPNVYQVWVKNERGVDQVRGGNFATRELAQRYADSGGLESQSQPGFDITPAMRTKAAGGVPLFMRREDGAPAPRSRFTLRQFGKASEFVQAVQDRYNRWKHVTADVRKQGGLVSESNDFYAAEERYWGKVAARLEDFQKEVGAFVKAVARDGLKLEDVQRYAYAKHAKERNAYLRGKRQDAAGFDAWSGMTDDEAQAILDDAQQAGLKDQLEVHHRTLQGWIQGTRDLMRDEGLITPQDHTRLSTMFHDYVPLRGLEGAVSKRPGTGQGFDVRGDETRHTHGRHSEASQIVEYIVHDRARTLVRSGKNEVLRSFLEFVLDNPSPNLWEVNAVESKPYLTVDADGNQVVETREAVITDDRTVAIKDGGRVVYIRIKDAALLEQLRNLHVEGLGRVVDVMLIAQRALGRMYTTLSPVFTMLNWARDVQTATIGMIDEVGYGAALKLWGKIPHAIGEAFKSEFGEPSHEYQLFRASGGKTGFMDFKDVDTLSKDLERQLANAERSGFDPRVWGPAALELVDKIHAGVENSTRLAAFLVAREEGKSFAEASRISKNITVNFNRKGTMTPQLSAWFLFFNPAVQGSVRVGQALKSPKVLATLGTGMAGVAMLAIQNASMGDDDDGVAWWDKIPPGVKDRNLVIVLPPGSKAGDAVPGSKEGRYIKIPMPYGWNFFATLANQAVDVWRHAHDAKRGAKPIDATLRAVTSFLGAYAPVSDLARSVESPKSALLAPVPDFLNPVAQSLVNVNSFGKPMYPDDPRSRNMPDSSKFFPGQAGTAFQRSAKALNAWTGGSKYRAGALDLTPATIENIVRSYGGGPASFTLDLINSMYLRQTIERPDLDARRLPFIKQLYGQIDAETDRVVGYERMEKITAASEPFERALREGHRAEARDLLEAFGPIVRMGDFIREQRSVLADIRKQELAIIDSSQSDTIKYFRLLALDERKRKVLQRVNAACGRALDKQQRAEGAARVQ